MSALFCLLIYHFIQSHLFSSCLDPSILLDSFFVLTVLLPISSHLFVSLFFLLLILVILFYLLFYFILLYCLIPLSMCSYLFFLFSSHLISLSSHYFSSQQCSFCLFSLLHFSTSTLSSPDVISSHFCFFCQCSVCLFQSCIFSSPLICFWS